MREPVVFGASYSVYVRIVRLALEEKGVPYRVSEVDIFASGGPPADYLERHPFARIPAFEHGDFHLYESGAITRYIDEAFPGPMLQPEEPRRRARLNQIISVLDNYAYRSMVWDIFVERVRAPQNGRVPNEERIASALPRAETCLRALQDIKGKDRWLTGATLTLADLHAAPIFAYFCMAPEGAALLARYADLQQWWHRMAVRPSMAATRSPLEGAL
ncbi:MAG: glutathione S-transferase family protein [Alphaproteobacteria bacterium]